MLWQRKSTPALLPLDSLEEPPGTCTSLEIRKCFCSLFPTTFLLLRDLKISSGGARNVLAPQEQEPLGKQGLKLPSAGEEN